MGTAGRVLIVDDYEPNLSGLRQLLENDGYDVLTASNGRDALHLVHRERPDLVLLDVVMPGCLGVRRLCVTQERGGNVPYAGGAGERRPGAGRAARRAGCRC